MDFKKILNIVQVGHCIFCVRCMKKLRENRHFDVGNSIDKDGSVSF